MSDHLASLRWHRQSATGSASPADYRAQRYSRGHSLHFDGGAVVVASASPDNVPLPWSDASAVDPEELFVASLASCHMLWFLSLAAAAGWCVDHYRDDASGTLARDADGRMAMTVVRLRPAVRFGDGASPDARQLQRLHDDAHRHCFIANSVRSTVQIEPQNAAEPAAGHTPAAGT